MNLIHIEYEYNQRQIIKFTCDYEALIQMLTTGKKITATHYPPSGSAAASCCCMNNLSSSPVL